MSSARALIGGRFLGVGIPGPELDDATRAHLLALRPGGVILFARNIVDVAQTRALIAAIRDLLGDVILMVDQEGGLVIRFARGLTVFPGNMALGAAGDASLARAQGRIAAAELRGVGFDLNCAPVCDLASDPENPGIGLRAFAADPGLAGRMAAAYIAGAREGGGATCAKHFPGLGGARVDAHLGMPEVDLDASVLRGDHLEPFRAAVEARVESVMTAHAVYPRLAPGQPAPFARPIITGLLRDELGFDGVIVSDDLEMGALAGEDTGSAAVRAMQAGHDLLLVCHTPAKQLAAAVALGTAAREGVIDQAQLKASADRLAHLSAQGVAARARDDAAPADGPAVAQAIADRSIARAGDTPLPAPGGSWIVLVPPLADLTLVEEACGGHAQGAPPAVAEALQGAGLQAAVQTYPLDPDGAAIEVARAAAADADRVLACTFDAARHPGQQALIRSLSGVCRALVVAHLRNPFDSRFVPDGVAQIQPWGFRASQLGALARVLAGELPPRHLSAPTP